MVPAPVAARITEIVAIPTIGIGAGAGCDGQVLVWVDMAGMTDWSPRFAKRFGEVGAALSAAATAYADEVRNGTFPDAGPPVRRMTARRAVLVAGIVVGAVLVALARARRRGRLPGRPARLVPRGPRARARSPSRSLLVALPGDAPCAAAARRRVRGRRRRAGRRAGLAERAARRRGRRRVPTTVVVLSFNTLDVVHAGGRSLALASTHHADVVVLPETSRRPAGQTVAALMAHDGHPMQVHTAAGRTPFVAGTRCSSRRARRHLPDRGRRCRRASARCAPTRPTRRAHPSSSRRTRSRPAHRSHHGGVARRTPR